jgi:hypothetical protein
MAKCLWLRQRAPVRYHRAVAWIFNDGASTVNLTASVVGTLVYRLKELWKAAGGIIQASSDGTNVSNTPGNANDQITSAAEMANNNAWFVLLDPSNRQFIFRRGTSDIWLIVYVPATVAGAAQAPTAAGTTAAVPTFTAQQALLGTLPNTAATWGAPGTRHYMIGARTDAPYGVFMVGWDSNGLSQPPFFMFDPLDAGTQDEDDLDRCIVHASATASPLEYQQFGGAVASRGYSRRGLTGETFGFFAALYYMYARGGSTDLRVVPRAMGPNPYNAYKEDPLPLIYCRVGGEWAGSGPFSWSGYKGQSSIVKWKSSGFVTGHRLQRVVAKDRIIVGDLTFPCDPTADVDL